MKTRGIISMPVIAVVALLAAGAATSASSSEPESPAVGSPGHEHAKASMGDMCPMRVQGTTLTATDVEGGIALEFTTSTGDVAELRKRVRQMAEMHNSHDMGGGEEVVAGSPADVGSQHEHAAGAGTGAGREPSSHQGMMMGRGMKMPAATATANDTDGGARLVLRPNNATQLDALREHVRTHAARMAHGDCPMMLRKPAGTSAPAASPNPGDASHEAHHTPPPGK